MRRRRRGCKEQLGRRLADSSQLRRERLLAKRRARLRAVEARPAPLALGRRRHKRRRRRRSPCPAARAALLVRQARAQGVSGGGGRRLRRQGRIGHRVGGEVTPGLVLRVLLAAWSARGRRRPARAGKLVPEAARTRASRLFGRQLRARARVRRVGELRWRMQWARRARQGRDALRRGRGRERHRGSVPRRVPRRGLRALVRTAVEGGRAAVRPVCRSRGRRQGPDLRHGRTLRVARVLRGRVRGGHLWHLSRAVTIWRPICARATEARRRDGRRAFTVLAGLAIALRLCVLARTGDALVVARHAPDALVRLGEDELLDLVLARTAAEAFRVIRLVACTQGIVSARLQHQGDRQRAPVTIASLCMGFWHALQMYLQFSQTGLPSARRSRLMLCSTCLLHLAQRLRSVETGGQPVMLDE